jgi:capsular polysaccharide export protein
MTTQQSHIGSLLKTIKGIHQSSLYAYGFSLRKQSIIKRFTGSTTVHFLKHVKHLPAESSLLLWGSHPVPSGVPKRVQIIRIEDGFLRSVGLGADLVQPISLVADNQGIYYDARYPSDLEHLLQHTEFSMELIERASLLRRKITEYKLTKYSVGVGSWHRSSTLLSKGQKVILVAGQVETDASIRYGACEIRTNLALLKAVRQANPEAFILYKPHPDVVAGLRCAGQGENQVKHWSNEVLTNVSIGFLLTEVDEVHVMTSLTGFEALLRDKPVTCYGHPFYSGWGLTKDINPLSRRTRQLSLEMLVAGSLILYPMYLSKSTGKLTSPECALDELLAWRDKNQNQLSMSRQISRIVIKRFFSQP